MPPARYNARPMKRLWSTFVVFGFLLRFLAYRVGLGERPAVDEWIEGITPGAGPYVGINKQLAWIHGDRVPSDASLVVCGNHAKLDDPLVIYHCVRMATGNAVMPRTMMRDDFFGGWLFDLLKGEEFFRAINGYPISRGAVSLSQLKPFLEMLGRGESFTMFPGRTRTRSGVLVEYREDFTEPGGVSFFLHHTQRKHPDRTVAALPVVRTHNPASGRSAVIFGEPLTLEPNAPRETQRTFDYDVIRALGPLVELNAAQIVCAILYLRALHGMRGPIAIEDLARRVTTVAATADYEHLDPHILKRPEQEVRAVAQFLVRSPCVDYEVNYIEPHPNAILATPPLDTTYRKANPVKYFTNQILHLGRVIEAIERVALERVD